MKKPRRKFQKKLHRNGPFLLWKRCMSDLFDKLKIPTVINALAASSGFFGIFIYFFFVSLKIKRLVTRDFAIYSVFPKIFQAKQIRVNIEIQICGKISLI
ncbi:hypothetical protein JTB14_009381 [Gonioctena quinquepunctata]|nr:hypothetical protein JTB14_009381 [Gonioctena quinquepunctata]